MNKILDKVLQRTKKVKFIKGDFTSGLVGNVYIGKKAELKIADADSLINAGLAVEDDGTDDVQLKAQAPIKASDAAVKFAEENGIDLSLVTGTGSGGNITKTDVEKYLEANPVEDDVNATDEAKALAAEFEVDLSEVTGTGDDGQITEDDVKSFIDDQE